MIKLVFTFIQVDILCDERDESWWRALLLFAFSSFLVTQGRTLCMSDSAAHREWLAQNPLEELGSGSCNASFSTTLTNERIVGDTNDKNFFACSSYMTAPRQPPLRPPPETKERRLAKEQRFNCPRCNSTNTKFCYYNNYSMAQPRYFCKTCRRYWTQGGSLRNVPVGGSSRKSKRSSSTSTTSSSSSITNASCAVFSLPHQNPKIQNHQDLNLVINQGALFGQYDILNVGDGGGVVVDPLPSSLLPVSAIELLRNPFMVAAHHQDPYYSPAGFEIHDMIRPPDHHYHHEALMGSAVQDGGNKGRISFPLEDLKQLSSLSAGRNINCYQAFDQQNMNRGGQEEDNPPLMLSWTGMMNGAASSKGSGDS